MTPERLAEIERQHERNTGIGRDECLRRGCLTCLLSTALRAAWGERDQAHRVAAGLREDVGRLAGERDEAREERDRVRRNASDHRIDLRRLVEAATAPGISEEARLEFTMQVFDAITPYTLLDLYARLDAQAARIAALEAAARAVDDGRGFALWITESIIKVTASPEEPYCLVPLRLLDALARALENQG